MDYSQSYWDNLSEDEKRRMDKKDRRLARMERRSIRDRIVLTVTSPLAYLSGCVPAGYVYAMGSSLTTDTNLTLILSAHAYLLSMAGVGFVCSNPNLMDLEDRRIMESYRAFKKGILSTQ